jgi:hypothetical protein
VKYSQRDRNIHVQHPVVQKLLVLLTDEKEYKGFNTREAYISDPNITRGIGITRYRVLQFKSY